MLRSKATRIIAGAIACGMVFVCGAKLANTCIESEKLYDEIEELAAYNKGSEMGELHHKLLMAGYMYVNHLDENGNYKGTEYAEKQTVEMLKKLGLMNAMGELDIDGGDFEYRVSYGDGEFSNTDKSHEELSSKYSLFHRDGCLIYNKYAPNNYIYDMVNWFTTDYGMTYYYISGMGYAIFDFDTEGCDSYVDELGATIYYKLDGTTPLPYDYVDLSKYMVVDDEQIYSFDENDTENYEDTIVEVTDIAETEHAAISAEDAESPTVENGIPDNAVSVTVTAGEAGDETPAVVEEVAETVTNADNEEVTENTERETVTEFLQAATEPPIESIIFSETEPLTEMATLPNVDNESFTRTQMSEADIMITICPSDSIIADFEKADQLEQEADEYVARGLVDLIPYGVIAVVLGLYVIIAGGYSKKEKKFVPTAADRVFAELYIGAGIAAAIGGIYWFDSIEYLAEFFNKYYPPYVFCILVGAVVAVVFGIILLALNTLVIRLKCRTLIKTSITGRILMLLWEMAKKLWKVLKKSAVKIYKNLSSVKADFLKNMATREMLRNDKFTRSFLFRTGIFAVLMIICSFICCLIANDKGIMFISNLIFGIVLLAGFVYLSLGDFKALKRMNEHISAVKSGDYTPRKEEVGSPIYAATERINEISTSIQETVEKQVKSERMKIELVTNVSHDLKTPLTSIISYIDLLSDEELPPAARDYVTIIEEKSQRLKTMVADLFDLAKATSRTDVQTEEIDAVVLTRQVLGDLADKIEASGRQLKCDIQAETAPIYADGKKMYRVFQNVIDNALKYSMEGTRVYLTLKREMGRCEIVVKNIASYEMTFSPDEITERFTRGDESRSTEGNGLGLSIAKSFTEACGGEFKVEIDGDVFIAKISLAISN